MRAYRGSVALPVMIELVERHTILAVVVGSRAYGLDGPGSDHDRRDVYAAPTRSFWRLDKPPTHVDGPAAEQFRLLHAGTHVLRTGEVLVDVAHLRDRLLGVRRGEQAWEKVAAWAAELLADLADAAAGTRLPEQPDRDAVDRLLIAVRERNL
jgi:hypothetical protein